MNGMGLGKMVKAEKIKQDTKFWTSGGDHRQKTKQN